MACTFGRGAVSGMNTVAGTSIDWAASATPCAWFPAEAATTPTSLVPGSSCVTTFMAPRILNDPVRCRFSALNHTSRSLKRENDVEWTVGVTTAVCAIRAWAERISSTDIRLLGTRSPPAAHDDRSERCRSSQPAGPSVAFD